MQKNWLDTFCFKIVVKGLKIFPQMHMYRQKLLFQWQFSTVHWVEWKEQYKRGKGLT